MNFGIHLGRMCKRKKTQKFSVHEFRKGMKRKERKKQRKKRWKRGRNIPEGFCPYDRVSAIQENLAQCNTRVRYFPLPNDQPEKLKTKDEFSDVLLRKSKVNKVNNLSYLLKLIFKKPDLSMISTTST